MFADAKREGCSIALKLSFFVGQIKAAASLFHQLTETKSGAFGLKLGREACCCKMSDIFDTLVCCGSRLV